MLEHQMVLRKWGGEKAQGMHVTLAALANIQMIDILITLVYSSV